MSSFGLASDSVEKQQLEVAERELADAINNYNVAKSAFSSNSSALISSINSYYLKRSKHLKG